MNSRTKVKSDLEFIRHLKTHGGDTMKKCYQCSTCTVVCSLSPEEYAFPRKEMINAGWGLKDTLVSDPDVWLCHGCMDCSYQCPRGARPADLLGAVRSYIYKNFAVPGFMGKAFDSPKYLFWLFLFPVIVIMGLILASHNWSFETLFPIPEGAYRYKQMVAHGPLEMLFIPGNIIVFAMAYLGYKKYWDSMKINLQGEPKKNFFKAAFDVVVEFLKHKKFNACKTNTSRYYGHLFVFYGFLGAMIATAIVVLDVMNVFGGKFLPEDMNMPIHLIATFNINNPNDVTEMIGLLTKSFGLFAGSLLVIGGLMMLIKRMQTQKRNGKSSYYDLLFLWVLWGVAVTGILLVVFRLSHTAILGYPTYFIHLVLVFFLLWYMPYSKFAHMIYRFLGLTFLKMYGRENKPEIFFKN